MLSPMIPPEDSFSLPPDAGSRFAEKRRVDRYSLALPVKIFEPINRQLFDGQTSKMSLRGCYVLISSPLERDTIIRVQIQRQQEKLDLWARVANIAAAQGMGLAFLRTEPQQEGVLARWLHDAKS
jgi:hypothetical protein